MPDLDMQAVMMTGRRNWSVSAGRPVLSAAVLRGSSFSSLAKAASQAEVHRP